MMAGRAAARGGVPLTQERKGYGVFAPNKISHKIGKKKTEFAKQVLTSEWPRRVAIPDCVASVAVLRAQFIRSKVANVQIVF